MIRSVRGFFPVYVSVELLANEGQVWHYIVYINRSRYDVE